MTIDSLVNDRYLTIDAFEGVGDIKQKIIAHGSAIVLLEDEPVGLITPLDLASKCHNLIIDCLTDKPRLSVGIKIPEALKAMTAARSETLAVYEGEQLLGTLFKGDLIDHVMARFESQSSNLQGVAHDLKRPISNMMGIFQLLEEDFLMTGNTELLHAAKQACSNASNLIDELVKPAPQDKGSLSGMSFDLRELLEEVILESEMHLNHKQISAHCTLPDPGFKCQGHALSVKRALGNIIHNAIKFTDPGGKITINAKASRNTCLLSIADNGIGIPEEIKPYLFKRFSQSARIGTIGEASTGLGLYITHSICKAYDIGIELDSKEGLGTCFNLKFTYLKGL